MIPRCPSAVRARGRPDCSCAGRRGVRVWGPVANGKPTRRAFPRPLRLTANPYRNTADSSELVAFRWRRPEVPQASRGHATGRRPGSGGTAPGRTNRASAARMCGNGARFRAAVRCAVRPERGGTPPPAPTLSRPAAVGGAVRAHRLRPAVPSRSDRAARRGGSTLVDSPVRFTVQLNGSVDRPPVAPRPCAGPGCHAGGTRSRAPSTGRTVPAVTGPAPRTTAGRPSPPTGRPPRARPPKGHQHVAHGEHGTARRAPTCPPLGVPVHRHRERPTTAPARGGPPRRHPTPTTPRAPDPSGPTRRAATEAPPCAS